MILYRLNWIVDRPNADGLCSVRLHVKWCRSKCVATFSLPYKIETSKWIQSAQRVKPNTSHGKNAVSAADINRRIGEYEQMVADIFAECDDVPCLHFGGASYCGKSTADFLNQNADLWRS